MNQQKAKQIRKMANMVYGDDLEYRNYGARQNSNKTVNGTIELGKCIRKAEKEMKRVYKNQ